MPISLINTTKTLLSKRGGVIWQYKYTYPDELFHHGIKGMKWGIRRFQKKNGSLTSAGKKRYDDGEKQKSNHRLRLEKQYQEYGLTKKQAQDAANKRIRTEKILAISAGVAVTACGAYFANKAIRNRIDGVIKAGETLQRVEMADTGGKLHDVFYTSKGSHDNKRYAGLLGMTRHQQTGKAFLMKLEASKDVKVASNKKAMEVFEDLYKNDRDFRTSVYEHVQTHFSGKNKADIFDQSSKKNMKKLYENFNSALINIRDKGSGADKKFYDKLKSAGYGAIQDINDKKFSGYNARNPLIVFDNKNNNIMVKSVKELSKDKVMADGAKESLKILLEDSAKTYGVLGTAGLTVAAVGAYAKNVDYEEVENYKYKAKQSKKRK